MKDKRGPSLKKSLKTPLQSLRELAVDVAPTTKVTAQTIRNILHNAHIRGRCPL